MTADKKLKAYIDRVLRLKEEQDTLGDDIREVYAEAKGEGYDKTIMGKLVAHLRKVQKAGESVVSEQEMVFDTYLSAYHRASGTAVATHTHEEEYDRETGEVFGDDVSAKLVATVATGMQTEIGRKALVTALDIMIEREEAEERRSDLGLNILTKHEDIRTAPETAEELLGGFSVAAAETNAEETGEDGIVNVVTGGESAEMDRATEGSFETGSEAAEKGREAIPAGPEGADLSHAGSGESPETLCEYCNGSGDVHRIDGEWLGRCHCQAGKYPSNDDADHAAGANAGGCHVESIAERERDGTPTSNTGEGAACALPDPDRFVEDVPPTPMKRLHYAHCFPELTKAEYGRLEFSIIGIGVYRPIIRMGDVIVDGWARYNICRALGISYPIKNYSGNDVLLDVIEWQRAARNFTPAQEKKIAAELAKEIPHRAGDIMAAFGLVEALEAAE
ncbi:GapR family DNA-binding domain-containing protein [Shinella sp. DD12]|uniref:GapR family DNA-binding domain-containing protein n=1 Tax=Shinella sp. DD12 TaxID=1410620 RepID=UPI000437A464|nr:GapR family DNA-binding domain-containing protein [Shinella sp. DD12]EYR81421.1 hypothetical protein SHLA_15c001060 [Shinella sp. DD12]